MYQLTDGRPLIGVKVTMRVLPSTVISLKSLLMRGCPAGRHPSVTSSPAPCPGAQDLAVGADQERVAHAAEVQGGEVSTRVCRLRSPPTTPML
jgi:hypothetical protein